MNNLQVFENKEFGNVRVVEISNQVWFIAKDICEALDLTNPTVAVDRLDDDERTKFNLGRQGRANVVNEYGLYNLVLSSRKKSAKKFKRWITHEVIPSIRKHGAYMTPETIERTLTDPDFIIGLAERLKDEQKKTKVLETKIEKDKPRIYFANEVSASRTTILVGEMAKLLNQTGIDIGQNRFYEWLRKNGYVVRRKGQDYNLPTQ